VDDGDGLWTDDGGVCCAPRVRELEGAPRAHTPNLVVEAVAAVHSQARPEPMAGCAVVAMAPMAGMGAMAEMAVVAGMDGMDGMDVRGGTLLDACCCCASAVRTDGGRHKRRRKRPSCGGTGTEMIGGWMDGR